MVLRPLFSGAAGLLQSFLSCRCILHAILLPLRFCTHMGPVLLPDQDAELGSDQNESLGLQCRLEHTRVMATRGVAFPIGH
ncbi:hypothetical protein F5Y01DRAFT_272968 [Xylaria sp. FL0043]|nr:hypothetical protein F5Y01DRAFT_272968 [Xylaria sp. FL0043]